MKHELLWAEDLVFQRENTGGLNHLDLSIGAGEALGIMGLSGSGKRILARILCGECSPDSGTIRQAGRVVRQAELSRQSLHIQQESRLLPNLSVTDNLLALAWGEGGFFFSERKLRALCREFLGQFGLTEYLRADPAEIPPAVQHRLLLAGAAVRKKRLIVLDHAADAYTEQEQQLLCKCIRQLCSCGKTVICLTGHLEPFLWEMDRVTVIRDGRRVKELSRNTFTETALRTYLCGYRAESTPYKERSTGRIVLTIDGVAIREGELIPVYDGGDTVEVFFRRLEALENRTVKKLTWDNISDSWISEFSVLENLLLAFGEIRKKRLRVSGQERQKLIRDCAEFTGMDLEQLSHPFSELNRFQRFQLLLYREKLKQTDLWLLNRMTAGADLQDRERMHAVTGNLPGIVFYVSGDYSELTTFGTRIRMLAGGRLQEERS